MGVAEIGIRVFLDDAASAGLFNINSAMSKLLTTTGEASGALSGMQIASAAVAGATLGFGVALFGFAGAIKYSVDAASELQQALFNVAVATHVPLNVAMQYATKLMDLAATSTYTSTEIAAGIAALGRSGYSLADIFTYMTNAGIALGIATRSTATEGFTMLAQAMSAYNAPAKDAIKYADLLQYGFEHQRGTISQFSAALSQATPAAAQFGIPLRDVIAALDVIGPEMSSTSTAGTALRYMVQGLLTPTAGAAQELYKLGLGAYDASGSFRSAFYDSQGNAMDFMSILIILSGKLNGLDQEAKMNALKALFSVRGGQGADIMLGNLKKMQDELSALAKSNDNAGGAMARWDQIMKTLAGATAGFTSSVRDLGASVGMAIIPALTSIVTEANKYITKMRGFAKDNPELAATFLLVGAALATLGIIAGGVFLLFTHPVIGIMAAGFLGAIAAVAGLSAAFLFVRTHMVEVQAVINTVVGVLKGLLLAAAGVGGALAGIKTIMLIGQLANAMPAVVGFAVTLVTQTIPALVAFGVALVQHAAQVTVLSVAMMSRMIPSLLASAGSWLLMAGAEVLAAAPLILIIALFAGMAIGLVLLVQHLGGMNLIIRAAQAIWAAMVATFNQVATIIRAQLMQSLQQLRPVWAQLVASFQQAQPALLVLGKILGAVLVVAFGLLIGVLKGAIMGFTAFVVAVITIAARIAQAVMGIVQVFMGFFTLLHGLVYGNTAEIQAGFATMGNGIRNIVTGLVGAVVAAFVGAFNIIRATVGGFVSGIIGFFSNLAGVLVHHSIVPDMMNAIVSSITGGLARGVSAVTGFVGNVLSFFTSLPGKVIGALAGLGSMLFSSGATAMQQFANGLASAIGAVVQQVENAAQTVANFLSHHSPAKMGPLSDDDKWMPNMMKMFASGINEHVPLIKTAAASAAGNIAGIPSIARVASAPSVAGQSVGGPGQGTSNFYFQVDSKTVSQMTINWLTGQMQMNGLARMNR